MCWEELFFFSARQAANRETHLVACPSSRKNYSWAFFSQPIRQRTLHCHCGCFSWARKIRNIAGLAHYVSVCTCWLLIILGVDSVSLSRQRIWMWSDWINKYIMLCSRTKKSLSLAAFRFGNLISAFSHSVCAQIYLGCERRARNERETSLEMKFSFRA